MAIIRILFIFLDIALIHYSFSLTTECSNNIAEYEVSIVGLELALEISIIGLSINGDSYLVVKQLHGEYKKAE